MDDIQLQLLGQVQDEALEADIRTVEHPRYPAYREAAHCHRAAEIVAQALNEDALEAAAECACLLDPGMRIDQPTILAIARANISWA